MVSNPNGADGPAEDTQADEPAREPFVGRSTATERDSNSSEAFSFWVRPNVRVNPFDIVDAEHLEGSSTYGLITNIFHSTDAASHLSNFISNDFGELVDEPNTPRQGTNVAEVSVLSNNGDIYMPVQSEARVAFADEAGIHQALGIDAMLEKQERENRQLRVPAGLVQMSNGVEAVAYLDADYVLGPESAHVNVSGISGLATKTSYMTFLIQSILQTLGSDDIAVVLLNVKFDDLLHIHEPRTLDSNEKNIWKSLGLDPRPFQDDRVHYLLPWGHDSARTEKPNSFGRPPDNYKLYSYPLDYTARMLDLLLHQIPDPSDTLGAVVGEVMQGLGQQPREAAWSRVKGWDDLLNDKPLVVDGQPKGLGSIRPASVGRFLRLMRRVVKTRQSGLFVNRLAASQTTVGTELSELQGGHTYVVDVAKLRPDEQSLVFGDVLRTVYDLFAGESSIEDTDLPSKVIVFVDELNKYAPAHARGVDTPILDQILDVAERGRSFGIVLFSAQQFLSAVHPRVVGNTATNVLGRTDSAELSDSAYRFLANDIRMHLTRLNKGELLLSHPIYRQPVKVRFPVPAYQLGSQQD
ncbi:MAG: ATP-binding protein [Chloroflexota bacterium]|nr:ATP-binding protein [Chloroflexota bacterium]MDE2894605.1 ATP-binding protein [Chloroflexota bacterium]